MSHQLPTPLPLFDRNLLRAVSSIVPSTQREEWSRAWQAELWYVHHRTRTPRTRNLFVLADLSIGLFRDALWLRTDSWRQSLSGTATLCLASLLGLNLLALLFALLVTGSWHALSPDFTAHFIQSLFVAPFVIFVVFATAARRHVEQTSVSNRLFWLKRQIFFTLKISQVLLLTFVLSENLCRPIRPTLPGTADVLQLFSFVIMALIGLRWALHDQEQRCKHCLNSLATPARVGRPSHNLLEWNGTELSCKQGHGLLSVPEMETSWCQSSQWVELHPDWERAASF